MAFLILFLLDWKDVSVEFIESLVSVLNNYLWSYILIAMLIGLGIWFTIRTKFVQIACLGEMFRLVGEGAGAKPRAGHISTFQAFCVTTASRVGVGNIAGIAIAVIAGGPGAVFWMWVIAMIGAATGFVESTLAQIYKVPRSGGGFLGGPAYYIKNALKSPFFAAVFAVLISATYGLIFNSVQANTISQSMLKTFAWNETYTGIGIAILTGLVIFGGLTRISKVVALIVPFMAGAYLIVAIVVMVMNASQIPTVLVTIVKSAFGFDPVMGAALGVAMMTGIKRGLFSNEAGMGSVPNAAATADATHPVKQGLVQSFGVYFDTFLVCTASAMLVLLTPGLVDLKAQGITGIALVQTGLEAQLGHWTNYFITLVVLFFAFSSIIGNYFYGEINMDFISKRKIALWIFRAAVVLMVFVGSVAKLSFVWDLADLFMALMAIVNLVAITLLGRVAFVALNDYLKQKKSGIANPEFDPKCLPNQTGVVCWPRHREEEIEQ